MAPTVASSENVSMIFKFFLFLQSASLVASFLKSSPLVKPFVRSKPCPFLRSSLALPLQSPASASASVAASTVSIDGDGPIGLYVHIPYCRRRCRYCSFAIVPIGPNVVTDVNTTSSSTDTTDTAQGGFAAMNQHYTTALLKEIANIATQQQMGDGKKIPLQTIYFGGGTPSLAPVETLALILDAIRAVDGPFSVQADAEISIEMDPGTFSKEKLQSVKDMGFNRISMGVQVRLVCCYLWGGDGTHSLTLVLYP
jgi:coproporphyrinogen III oxidase-like Fe-S oxidoreductase